jgi:type I restriction enzyme S subunit
MISPDTWREVYLLDVCELNPRATTRILDVETSVSYISLFDVSDTSAYFAAQETRPFGTLPSGRNLFREGDILFASTGADCGKAAIATNLFNGVGAGMALHVLRPGPQVAAQYLVHIIRQPSFKNQAIAEMLGATGQPRVSASFFYRVKIRLPPLEEQLLIVETLKQASIEPYQAALNHAIDLQDALATELLITRQTTKKATSPRVYLLDVCQLNPRRKILVQPKIDDDIRHVSRKSIDPIIGSITVQLRSYGELSKGQNAAFDNDVLFPRFFQTKPGLAAVVRDIDPHLCLVSPAFHILRPEKVMLADYLAIFLRLNWFREQASAEITGFELTGLPAEFFSRVRIPLPSVEDQRDIVRVLNEIPIASLRDALTKARTLHQTLVVEALTGRLTAKWRNANIAQTGMGSLDTVPYTEIISGAQPSGEWNSKARSHREAAVIALSDFQEAVWKALSNETAMALLADAPEIFERFCSGLYPEDEESNALHTDVRRALEQLAALGLIRKMSLPRRVTNNESEYQTAFRLFGLDEHGRITEDTGASDAQDIATHLRSMEAG